MLLTGRSLKVNKTNDSKIAVFCEHDVILTRTLQCCSSLWTLMESV